MSYDEFDFQQWQIIPHTDKVYFQIRNIGTGQFLSSQVGGNLTVEESSVIKLKFNQNTKNTEDHAEDNIQMSDLDINDQSLGLNFNERPNQNQGNINSSSIINHFHSRDLFLV